MQTRQSWLEVEIEQQRENAGNTELQGLRPAAPGALWVLGRDPAKVGGRGPHHRPGGSGLGGRERRGRRDFPQVGL